MSRQRPTVAGRLSGRQSLRFVGSVLRAQARELPGLVRARRGQRQDVHLELREPPSTTLTRSAHEEILDVASPAILGHSLRCWYLADLFAQLDGLAPDSEELYLACALHDIALTDAHRPPAPAGCFAIHGGRIAAVRTQDWGGTAELGARIEHAIARHVDPTGDSSSATALLLHEAAFCDVVGTRAQELAHSCLAMVHVAHPRTGFTESFAAVMAEEARLRPRSRTGLLWRSGMVLRMRLNPLDDWYGGARD